MRLGEGSITRVDMVRFDVLPMMIVVRYRDEENRCIFGGLPFVVDCN